MPLNDYRDWLRHSIASIDDFIDLRWRMLKQRMVWDGIPRIQPYIGFANDDFAWMHGRALTNPPKDLPSEDDSWWDNLLQTYQRFESDEVPDVDIEIDFAGKLHRVTTDDEGYFHLETTHTPDVRGQQPWQSIAMRIVGNSKISPDESATFSKMLTPSTTANFGIISDIFEFRHEGNSFNLAGKRSGQTPSCFRRQGLDSANPNLAVAKQPLARNLLNSW